MRSNKQIRCSSKGRKNKRLAAAEVTAAQLLAGFCHGEAVRRGTNGRSSVFGHDDEGDGRVVHPRVVELHVQAHEAVEIECAGVVEKPIRCQRARGRAGVREGLGKELRRQRLLLGEHRRGQERDDRRASSNSRHKLFF